MQTTDTYNKRRYHALRAMGRCVACGKPSKEKTRCPECMKRASKATYKWLRKANKQKNEELEYLRARVKELESANE